MLKSTKKSATKTKKKSVSIWTDSNVEILKTLHKQQHSARQIAQALNDNKQEEGGRKFTRCSVIGKMYRLGLSKKKDGSDVVEEKFDIMLVPELNGGCQWPVGEPGKRNFYFCEATSMKGFPYCEEHCREAFRNGFRK